MATHVSEEVYVDGSALLVIVEEWASRGVKLYARLSDAHAKLVQQLRLGNRERVGLDVADRLLVAIGQEHRLWEIAPEPANLEPGECAA